MVMAASELCECRRFTRAVIRRARFHRELRPDARRQGGSGVRAGDFATSITATEMGRACRPPADHEAPHFLAMMVRAPRAVDLLGTGRIAKPGNLLQTF